MKFLSSTVLISTLMLGMVGCNNVPKSIVTQPTYVRPTAPVQGAQPSGSIFQAGVSRTLFEGRMARYPGDSLTILISENLTAKSASNTKAKKTNSMELGTPNIALGGLMANPLSGFSIGASSSSDFEGDGSANSSNLFTGVITATVVEVLPNGNLLVSGEKQIAINNEQQTLRMSGVINPMDLDSNNQIVSTRVADVKMEQRSSGITGLVQDAGWLTRFFLSISPF